MTVHDADASVDDWIALFTLHRDERLIFQTWREVVRDNGVTGRAAHDARIVTAMKRHGIVELLTYDTKDFQRYAGIIVLPPESVISGP